MSAESLLPPDAVENLNIFVQKAKGPDGGGPTVAVRFRDFKLMRTFEPTGGRIAAHEIEEHLQTLQIRSSNETPGANVLEKIMNKGVEHSGGVKCELFNGDPAMRNDGKAFLTLRVTVTIEAIGATNIFEIELVDSGPLDTEWLQARLQQREEALSRQKEMTNEARERAMVCEQQVQNQNAQIKELEGQLDSMSRTVHMLTGCASPVGH